MKQLLLVASFCLALYAAVPYMIDIVKRKTKPNIVTWFTWTLLTGIATAAAFAAGEPRSAIITLAISIQTGSIVLLGLKYGVAKMTWFDGFCQLAVVAGLILWLLLKSPIIAIVASVAIDFIGLLPTAKHSWLKPSEETWQSYGWSAVAALMTVVALEHLTLAGLLFPVYLVFADGGIMLIVLYKRRIRGLKLSRN